MNFYTNKKIKHMDVDIMPGEFDPSNLLVPQQPLHHAMFTRSIGSDHKYNLHTCPNPYAFAVNEHLSFLGTSGQFIDDMRKSTSCDDPIDLMKTTLECGHIGPTCPDTLASYPYYGKDPFILDHLPNVFFAGNQAEFKFDLYRPFGDEDDDVNAVRLISLPKFSATQSCVFFNLNTLTCQEVNF